LHDSLPQYSVSAVPLCDTNRPDKSILIEEVRLAGVRARPQVDLQAAHLHALDRFSTCSAFQITRRWQIQEKVQRTRGSLPLQIFQTKEIDLNGQNARVSGRMRAVKNAGRKFAFVSVPFQN